MRHRTLARQREDREIESYWHDQERAYEAATQGVEGLFFGLYNSKGEPLHHNEQVKAKIREFLEQPSIETWAAVAFLEVCGAEMMWRIWQMAEPDKGIVRPRPGQPWKTFPDPDVIAGEMRRQGHISPRQRRRPVPRWF